MTAPRPMGCVAMAPAPAGRRHAPALITGAGDVAASRSIVRSPGALHPHC